MNKDNNWIYILSKNSNISYPKDWNSKCYQLEDDSFWFNHRSNVILHLIKKYFDKSSSFCDIWWWNGYSTKKIQEYINDTTLLEPWYQWCLNAKERWLNNIVCWELSNNFKLKFDWIWIFDVIEHIEEQEIFLNNIYNSLNVNWKLILTVPAFSILWSYEDENAWHFRRYNRKTLKLQLEKSWFEIIYINYFFKILFFPVYILRRLLGFIFSNVSNNKQHKNSYLINYLLNKELKILIKWKKINYWTSLICIAKKIW